MNVCGNELIQTAIYYKQPLILRYFLDQGASFQHAPPSTISKLYTENNNESELYRPSPWAIQAACAGNVEVFKIVLESFTNMTTSGHICLSKRRKN